jgi:hypothetical protein
MKEPGRGGRCRRRVGRDCEGDRNSTEIHGEGSRGQGEGSVAERLDSMAAARLCRFFVARGSVVRYDVRSRAKGRCLAACPVCDSYTVS